MTRKFILIVLLVISIFLVLLFTAYYQLRVPKINVNYFPSEFVVEVCKSKVVKPNKKRPCIINLKSTDALSQILLIDKEKLISYGIETIEIDSNFEIYNSKSFGNELHGFFYSLMNLHTDSNYIATMQSNLTASLHNSRKNKIIRINDSVFLQVVKTGIKDF